MPSILYILAEGITHVLLLFKLISYYFPITEKCMNFMLLKIFNICPQIITPKHFHAEECAICLTKPILPLATNCCHLFCGPCMRTYWESSGRSWHLFTCPLCRCQINRLLPLNASSFIYSKIMANDHGNNKSSYMTLCDFVTNFNKCQT